MISNVTMEQAQAHWRAHTRKVLTTDASRKAAEVTLWGYRQSDGAPRCTIGLRGEYSFVFEDNGYGHVHAVQVRT